MADNIHVNLPDGSVKEVPKGTTALDIAKSIGQRLADATLVAKTNGDLIDITRPLEESGGGVVEVNAGPGLRMHLEPSAGKKKRLPCAGSPQK